MKRLFAMLFMFCISPVNGLELGKVDPLSRQGEPLEIRVPISELGQSKVSDFFPLLGSKDAFKLLNLARTEDLSGIVFTFADEPAGIFLYLRTATPWNAPKFGTVVEIFTPSGPLIFPVVATIEAKPAAIPTVKLEPVSQTMASDSLLKQIETVPDRQRVPVVGGDTLWRIAEKVKPKENTIEQMIFALFELNPDAFDYGNINALRRDSFLEVPVQKKIGAHTGIQAKQLFDAHMKEPKRDFWKIEIVSGDPSLIVEARQIVKQQTVTSEAIQPKQKKEQWMEESINSEEVFQPEVSVEMLLTKIDQLEDKIDSVDQRISRLNQTEEKESVQSELLTSIGEKNEVLEPTAPDAYEALEPSVNPFAWLIQPIELISEISIFDDFLHWVSDFRDKTFSVTNPLFLGSLVALPLVLVVLGALLIVLIAIFVLIQWMKSRQKEPEESDTIESRKHDSRVESGDSVDTLTDYSFTDAEPSVDKEPLSEVLQSAGDPELVLDGPSIEQEPKEFMTAVEIEVPTTGDATKAFSKTEVHTEFEPPPVVEDDEILLAGEYEPPDETDSEAKIFLDETAQNEALSSEEEVEDRLEIAVQSALGSTENLRLSEPRTKTEAEAAITAIREKLDDPSRHSEAEALYEEESEELIKAFSADALNENPSWGEDADDEADVAKHQIELAESYIAMGMTQMALEILERAAVSPHQESADRAIALIDAQSG